MFTTRSFGTVTCGLLASALACCFTVTAQAEGIEVIYTEIATHSSSTVPGAKDLAGDPADTDFLSMLAINFSPDGRQWILKGSTVQGSDLANVMLLGNRKKGEVFAQEGQPVDDGEPGELYDFFDDVAGFNNDSNFAFGARAKNGDTTVKEKVITVIGGVYTIVAHESSPTIGLIDNPPEDTGDEVLGNSLNGIHLLDDESVGYVAVTINNIHSSRRPALFYNLTSFAQSGVTMIGAETWDSFDSDDFRTTPDGAHWYAQGDFESDTAFDDVLVYDGAIALRQGSVVPGSAVVMEEVFATYLLPNGVYYSRGDDPANLDWVALNGQYLTGTGDSASGGAESWGDAIGVVVGNTKGDYVIAGNTDNANPDIDNVAVMNGDTEIVREGDPVDLDGNGVFDDDVFVRSFTPNDAYLGNNRFYYFLATLQNAAGDNLGDAYLRIILLPLGDVNCDRSIDAEDIDPFFLALGDADAYANAFPDCDIVQADINKDNGVDSEDIDPFFECLGLGVCP